MSNNVAKFMKRKLEKERQAKSNQAGHIAFEVEGEEPARQPYIGELVRLHWGDPNLVGAPVIPLTLIVTTVGAGGRVNGQAFTDPAMSGVGQDGRPISLPPLIPMGNLPFAREPRAMTWQHIDEFAVARQLVLEPAHEPKVDPFDTPEEV